MGRLTKIKLGIQYGIYRLQARIRKWEPDNFDYWQLDREYLAYLKEDEQFGNYAWLCWCGHYQEDGLHCEYCGGDPPWGCDCGFCNEALEDEWLDSWTDYPGDLLAEDIDFGKDPDEQAST